jgi:hypothetical protein
MEQRASSQQIQISHTPILIVVGRRRGRATARTQRHRMPMRAEEMPDGDLAVVLDGRSHPSEFREVQQLGEDRLRDRVDDVSCQPCDGPSRISNGMSR